MLGQGPHGIEHDLTLPLGAPVLEGRLPGLLVGRAFDLLRDLADGRAAGEIGQLGAFLGRDLLVQSGQARAEGGRLVDGDALARGLGEQSLQADLPLGGRLQRLGVDERRAGDPAASTSTNLSLARASGVTPWSSSASTVRAPRPFICSK